MQPPPIIAFGLTRPLTLKLMAWKLMWHSRHNLIGGAFSRLGYGLPWG